MQQFLLLIAFSIFSTSCFSQFEAPIEFIDFKTEIKNLSSSDSSLHFDNKWEYINLLFLDSSILNGIAKKYPKVAEKYTKHYSSKQFDTLLTVERFKNNSRVLNIKDCFNNSRVLTIILKSKTWLRKSPADRIHHKIYLNDNSAIYEVSEDNYSEVNIITLTETQIIIQNVSNFVL